MLLKVRKPDLKEMALRWVGGLVGNKKWQNEAGQSRDHRHLLAKDEYDLGYRLKKQDTVATNRPDAETWCREKGYDLEELSKPLPFEFSDGLVK